MSELSLATISVTGSDAFEFLQNQLTNDLGLLESEAEILAAWCNPKGRVVWFGTVQATESGYSLSVLADIAEDIVERLNVFVFRSKVEFAIDPGGSVDPAFLIQNGFVYIDREQMEQFTPHMLNLDLIGAVNLDKGCYPGQEIVARTHYRGATKRRCLRFESAEPVSPGDKVSDGSRDVGQVVNAIGTDLLAVVPIDLENQELTVNGIALVQLPLPYL
jgi:folate-binding protein YgfZ